MAKIRNIYHSSYSTNACTSSLDMTHVTMTKTFDKGCDISSRFKKFKKNKINPDKFFNKTSMNELLKLRDLNIESKKNCEEWTLFAINGRVKEILAHKLSMNNFGKLTGMQAELLNNNESFDSVVVKLELTELYEECIKSLIGEWQ